MAYGLELSILTMLRLNNINLAYFWLGLLWRLIP